MFSRPSMRERTTGLLRNMCEGLFRTDLIFGPFSTVPSLPLRREANSLQDPLDGNPGMLLSWPPQDRME